MGDASQWQSPPPARPPAPGCAGCPTGRERRNANRRHRTALVRWYKDEIMRLEAVLAARLAASPVGDCAGAALVASHGAARAHAMMTREQQLAYYGGNADEMLDVGNPLLESGIRAMLRSGEDGLIASCWLGLVSELRCAMRGDIGDEPPLAAESLLLAGATPE